jgi:SAM-dependent methyltransferase
MADDVSWYHTIDLPDGTTTPGWFDTRPSLKKIPFPESLDGKRCLDIGTADGFFAFEMEKRGAKEVVAIDVDDPMKRDWPWNAKPTAADLAGSRKPAFTRAKELLGSSVHRENVAIYDLDPEVVGHFDFAFIGSLLLHLRDPVRALAAVARVLDGELLVADSISIYLSLAHPIRPTARFEARDRVRWWVPNQSGLRSMIVVAGYDVISHGGPYFIPVGDGFRRMRLKGIRNHRARRITRELVLRSLGFPHAWVLARPRG